MLENNDSSLNRVFRWNDQITSAFQLSKSFNAFSTQLSNAYAPVTTAFGVANAFREQQLLMNSLTAKHAAAATALNIQSLQKISLAPIVSNMLLAQEHAERATSALALERASAFSALSKVNLAFLDSIAYPKIPKTHFDSLAMLGKSYESLTTFWANELTSSFPISLAAEMPAFEMFRSTEVIRSFAEPILPSDLCEPIISQTELSETLISDLSDLGSELSRMWRGAVASLESDNPDKRRHFIISTRELLTHLLHIVAPTDKVASWTSDETLYHDGRPTRKARLMYVSRHAQSDDFSDFLVKDIQSMLAMIDLLNKGTHKPSVGLSEYQLKALKHRAEGTIKFILELHRYTP